MSFEERQTWVQALVTLGVAGPYFANVLRLAQHTPVSEIEYQPLLLWNIGIVIVVMIAAMIAVMIAAHIKAAIAGEIAAHKRGDATGAGMSEVDMKNFDRRDERDANINRLGGYIGGIVLGVGALVPLGLAMTERDHFWIANALYAGLVLSALASSAVKIVAYRRGL